MSNFKPGSTVQFRAGHPQQGKVVKLLRQSSLPGYSNADGSVVDCPMWEIHPPMMGFDGQRYNVAAEPHLFLIRDLD